LNNKKLISNNIKDREDQEKFCFLINKSWINKVKNSYKYNLLIPELRTLFLNEKFSKYIQSYGYNVLFYNSQLMKELLDDNSLKTLSNKLDDLDEKKIIDELRNLNLFLIDFKYHEEESKSFNYIKLYEDFEIITFEKNKQKNNENNNLIDILFPLIEKKFKIFKYKKNEENYFFFYDDNNSEKIIYACSPYEKNDEININLELIIKGKNIDETFNKIKSDSYINYILSLDFNDKLVANLNNSEGKAIILNKVKGGVISKKMEEKKILKTLIFNFADFIHNIKIDSKKKIVNKENIIYLAPKQYIFK
jgi:formylmethanofuran dehydrogenase subunit D